VLFACAGDNSEDNQLTKGTAPVLTWYAAVDSVKTDTGPDGKPRKVAVVNLAPHRCVILESHVCHDAAVDERVVVA
jgi:hypothetical protein